MIHPRLGHVESRKRPSQTCSAVCVGWHAALDALFDEARFVLFPLKTTELSPITEVSAGLTITLRERECSSANGGIGQQEPGIIRTSIAFEQSTGTEQFLTAAMYVKPTPYPRG